jgi:hypothetical protein
VAVLLDRLIRTWRYPEVQLRRKPHRSQHSQVIFSKSLAGITNRSDEALLEIATASDVVDHFSR